MAKVLIIGNPLSGSALRREYSTVHHIKPLVERFGYDWEQTELVSVDPFVSPFPEWTQDKNWKADHVVNAFADKFVSAHLGEFDFVCSLLTDGIWHNTQLDPTGEQFMQLIEQMKRMCKSAILISKTLPRIREMLISNGFEIIRPSTDWKGWFTILQYRM
jgi:hypothetical protein